MKSRLVLAGETDGGTPMLYMERGFKRCVAARKDMPVSMTERAKGCATMLTQLGLRPVRFRARSHTTGPCICPGCDRICDLPLGIAAGQEFEVWV